MNMSKLTLELLLHSGKERAANILLISEPGYVPLSAGWFSSIDRKAAIYVDPKLAKESCELILAGLLL